MSNIFMYSQYERNLLREEILYSYYFMIFQEVKMIIIVVQPSTIQDVEKQIQENRRLRKS